MTESGVTSKKNTPDTPKTGSFEVSIPDELKSAIAEYEVARTRVDTTQRALQSMNGIGVYYVENWGVNHALEEELALAQGYYTHALLHLIFTAMKYQAELAPLIQTWREKTVTFI